MVPTLWRGNPSPDAPRPFTAERQTGIPTPERGTIKQKILKLEKQQRRQRQDIFQVGDSIIKKRDTLVDSLEGRLTQKTESQRPFTICWEVV